jgi:hypothetical protein
MTDRSDPTIDDLVDRMLPGLSPASRRRLAAIGRDERPVAGVHLMREGRPTRDLGLIVEGQLAVRDSVGGADIT